jgi:hypothetical protein
MRKFATIISLEGDLVIDYKPTELKHEKDPLRRFGP